MDCFSQAFAQLLTHHDDHENLLAISKQLDACLQQHEKRRVALLEQHDRVTALVKRRQDADDVDRKKFLTGPD